MILIFQTITMSKKQSNKKDYIDEHEEWQRHQFNPGHFTGGRIPIWIKKPCNRKRLGKIFLTLGLFYSGWTVFNIIQLGKLEQATAQIVSAIFLGSTAIIFIWAGIKLIKKS